MNIAYKKLQRCLNYVRSKTDFVPEVALVLGSGLGDFGNIIQVEETIAFDEIESFPVSTVMGHSGRFLLGTLKGVPVVVMQGRVHYYEGYPVSDVVLPARLMRLMGAKALFLTNAVGAINKNYSPGDFMLIRDHILFSVPSPLLGVNIDELGPRFPDMSTVYNDEFCDIIRQTARRLGIHLQDGVYVQVAGPNFETPAEIRMYGVMGADVVGMSTAVEAIAANHMGMKICGVSCVSNMAAGISKNPLSHAEVIETSERVAPQFNRLIAESVAAIAQAL